MEQANPTTLEEAISDFSMIATYLPQNLESIEDSRGVFKRSDLNKQQLKYQVAISYKGRPLIETSYSMGIGHIPGFREPRLWTVPVWNTMKWVFREGKAPASTAWDHNYAALLQGKPIVPKLKDVLHCLVVESDTFDYDSFESWASDFGYDQDSRRAEEIYQACLKTALKLRSGIGQDKLNQLREAYQDY